MIGFFKKILKCVYFFIKETKTSGGGKYLFIHEPKSRDLVIVFSGFSEIRSYQYIMSLKNVKINKLFIADMWGYNGEGNKGSYYWYHLGTIKPEIETSKIIENFLLNKYKKIYMIGSSKGGTAAIYYGLKYNTDVIISAACQFNVGKYLSDKDTIIEGMMGVDNRIESVRILDNKMRGIISCTQSRKMKIILFYSKEEHTYKDDIVDLINELRIHNYDFYEVVSSFKYHSEVGVYFSEYLSNYFNS